MENMYILKKTKYVRFLKKADCDLISPYLGFNINLWKPCNNFEATHSSLVIFKVYVHP